MFKIIGILLILAVVQKGHCELKCYSCKNCGTLDESKIEICKKPITTLPPTISTETPSPTTPSSTVSPSTPTTTPATTPTTTPEPTTISTSTTTTTTTTIEPSTEPSTEKPPPTIPTSPPVTTDPPLTPVPTSEEPSTGSSTTLTPTSPPSTTEPPITQIPSSGVPTDETGEPSFSTSDPPISSSDQTTKLSSSTTTTVSIPDIISEIFSKRHIRSVRQEEDEDSNLRCYIIKYQGEDDDEEIVDRGCIEMQETTEDTCKLAAPSSIIEYTKCNLCDKELCNSGSSLIYSLMTISLAIVVVLNV